MGVCSCVNKLFLVFLNFVIFAFGVVVVALSSVVIHKSSEYGELLFDGILTLPIWCLVVGIAIALLGFFGCCGALWENSCMLYTYATIVTVLFLAEITLGILVAIFPGKATEHIKKGMTNAFQKYDEDDSLKKGIDAMQHDLECCGVNGPLDWTLWIMKTPESCCRDPTACSIIVPKDLYQRGCLQAIASELKGVTLALGITAIVLAVIQVMCICIACGLARKRSEYV